MFPSCSSQWIVTCPLIQPVNPKIRLSAFCRSSASIPRRYWMVQTHPRPMTRKWKISCFRHDEISSAASNSDFIGRLLPGDLFNPKIEGSEPVKRDWITKLIAAVDGLLEAAGKPWTVPWTVETILKVMLLWIASFWLIGSWAVPFAAHSIGYGTESLTHRGQALFSLFTDLTEGLAGVAILHKCLSPFFPLQSDWFKLTFRGTWHLDVVLGCLMFPLIKGISQINLNLLPNLPSAPVTLTGIEHSIAVRDPVAMVIYAVVVSVCAPIWEEIVFRGFLLPSLTKYMPVWCAILVSSVAFALTHFSMQRMLPLVVLGAVMGVVFSRSRNLLPSMLLHSLWNGYVFFSLMN